MCKKCLILLMVGILVVSTGCRGDESAVQENEVGIQTEEVEIELPEEEILQIDYTTASELQLPAGTRIAVVAKNAKEDYWKAVETGMGKAIEDLNTEAGLQGDDQIVMTFEGPSESDDAETQINTIDAVLSENPQVLCLSAIDMTSCAAQLETAAENGIPVIIFDSGLQKEELVYTVCKTDNFEAGKEAAKRLLEQTGDDAEILIVASSNETESIVDRVNGFKNICDNEYENISIVNILYANESEDVKEQIVEILEMNPNIQGCFATDESMAKEVLDAFDKVEAEGIPFVGFDAGKDQQKAIRDGKELGIVCQNPYGMGYATIISAARAVLGLENDKVIDAGYQWIDIMNIDEEENQKFLYE